MLTMRCSEPAIASQLQSKRLVGRVAGSLGGANIMAQNVPVELQTSINRQVLDHVDGLSAHSDIAEALSAALKPLGDVQIFCPDWQQYRYVVASTKGIIIALAVGMDTTGFRLDERMKARALASGGVPYPECGDQWVAFTLFRDDWPRIDIEFWARKAYVAARELER